MIEPCRVKPPEDSKFAWCEEFTWRKEFCLRNFTFVSGNPERFVKCQWHYERGPSTLYLIYRWIITATFIASMVFSIASSRDKTDNPLYWFIPSRNWNLLMCMVQGILSSIMVTMYQVPRLRESPNLHQKVLCPYKFYWYTHIIAVDLSVLVVIRFWGTLYRTNEVDPIEKKYDLVANYFQHFANPVIMTVDTFLVSHPVKLFQTVHPLFFHMLYDLFSYVCYAAGANTWNNLYVNAWKNPKWRVLTSVEDYGLLCGIHVAFFILQKMRKSLYFILFPYCYNPLLSHEDILIPAEDLFSLKLSDEAMTTSSMRSNK